MIGTAWNTREQEVTGSVPAHNTPKSLKMVLELNVQSQDWLTQCEDNVTGCGIMSSVWGMIFYWGSTMAAL